MKKHLWVYGLVLLFSTFASAKPNVVYLFADQMRAEAMRCMGNTLIQTPNLDKLATQGLLASNAYTCTPLCTPYRAQLMTGMYGWHNGCPLNDLKLPNNLTCIAEIFKANGYATGYIGKWHLNGDRGGFVQIADRQGWDFWAALACSHEYFNTLYYYDDPKAPVKIVNGYEPAAQTDEAIGFIKRNLKNPFILMVSYGPPHFPYPPPPEYNIYKPADIPLRPNVPKSNEGSARSVLVQYYGLTTSIDVMVGRIMKTLDSLGLSDSTILAFSSDHGDMHYSQGQGQKVLPWQESVNIPFIIRYPKAIAPNRKSDALINSIDVMPTLLGLAGINVPGFVDGKNIAPLFTGASTSEQKSILLAMDMETGNGMKWAWRAIVEKDWKYVMHSKGGWLLYNLKNDPYEMRNLIDSAKYRNEYCRLHWALQDMRKATGDTAKMPFLVEPPAHSAPPPRGSCVTAIKAPLQKKNGDQLTIRITRNSRRSFTIRYTVSASSGSAAVSLRIHSLNGELVKTLSDGMVTSGSHSLQWDGAGEDGRAVRSGCYLCKVRCGQKDTRQALVFVQ